MKIMLLAGEESGLMYANRIAEILRAGTVPGGVEIRGYRDFGFETADLAVMGFFTVLGRLPYFLRVSRTMKRAIREWRPDAVVTVDYPGMNIPLAAYAKSLGIPSIHLVCPQVWAWRSWRIPKIAASLTKLLCFLPFEPDVFKGTGLDAEFIGHPLADAFAGADRPERVKGLVAVLPGSRMGEVRRHMPRLMKAVEGLNYTIPAANARVRREILRYAPPERVTDGGARELLMRAECAVVASGTATLEAALARCPTVLVYAVSQIQACLLHLLITGVKHAGLANVIAEKAGTEPPMPELLQNDFTPEAVRRQLDIWLSDGKARAAAAAKLDSTMAMLENRGRDAMDAAAAAILDATGKGQR